MCCLLYAKYGKLKNNVVQTELNCETTSQVILATSIDIFDTIASPTGKRSLLLDAITASGGVIT